MTLSIISFFKYDNAILPLSLSHGSMEMRGKLFSYLEIHTKNILAGASNSNVLFSVFFLI